MSHVENIQKAVINLGNCLKEVAKHGVIEGGAGLSYHQDYNRFFSNHFNDMQHAIDELLDDNTFTEILIDNIKKHGHHRLVDIYVSIVVELVAQSTKKCWCGECDNDDDNNDDDDNDDNNDNNDGGYSTIEELRAIRSTMSTTNPTTDNYPDYTNDDGDPYDDDELMLRFGKSMFKWLKSLD